MYKPLLRFSLLTLLIFPATKTSLFAQGGNSTELIMAGHNILYNELNRDNGHYFVQATRTDVPLITRMRMSSYSLYDNLTALMTDTSKFRYIAGSTRGTDPGKLTAYFSNSSADTVLWNNPNTASLYVGALFTYNSNHLPSGAQYYAPDGSSAGEVIYQYNSAHLLTYYSMRQLNVFQNAEYREVKQWNDAGMVLKDSTSRISPIDPSYNYRINNNYTYDNSNRKLTSIELLSTNNFSFVSNVQRYSSYLGSSNVPWKDSVIVESGNVGNTYTSTDIYKYSYDAQNRHMIDSVYKPNQSTAYKYIKYAYTPSNITTATYYSKSGSSWVAQYKTITQLNAQGNTLAWEDRSIDNNGAETVMQKEVYTYNAAGYITSYVRYAADATTNSLFVNIRRTITRNGENCVTSQRAENYGSGNTAFSDKTYTYYYTEFEDGMGLNDNRRVIAADVYPNPANDYILVAVPELQGTADINVYSIEGKQLFSTKTKKQSYQLNTEAYTKGIYIIQINTAKGQAIKQFIIK